MKKLLILGSRGMAGHIMKLYLSELNKYDVHDLARGSGDGFRPVYDLDVFDRERLKELVATGGFHVLINCIGSLNKDAEDHPDKAIYLNSYLPHLLASLARSTGAKLIHISTDCVFSGSKGGYHESDCKDGKGYYAQSKALGEVNDDSNLTFRTSIIGPELKNGIGLLHWFMMQQGAVNGYSRAFWTGVTTLELARAVDAAIEQNLTGLYHLVNNEKISKYNLLRIFNETFDKKLAITDNSSYSVDKSLVNNRTDFNFAVGSYQGMIAELKEWMKKHRGVYMQYSI